MERLGKILQPLPVLAGQQEEDCYRAVCAAVSSHAEELRSQLEEQECEDRPGCILLERLADILAQYLSPEQATLVLSELALESASVDAMAWQPLFDKFLMPRY